MGRQSVGLLEAIESFPEDEKRAFKDREPELTGQELARELDTYDV